VQNVQDVKPENAGALVSGERRVMLTNTGVLGRQNDPGAVDQLVICPWETGGYGACDSRCWDWVLCQEGMCSRPSDVGL
jgi:hypothetical protein